MSVERWYITGLLIALLAVSCGVLYIRWATLQQRVPLNTGNPATIAAMQNIPAGNGDERRPVETARNVTDIAPETDTTPSATLDINSATGSELEQLPGIGPVLAGRIIEYRDRCGPFRGVDDLLEVEGIGPSKLSDIRGLIDVRTGP